MSKARIPLTDSMIEALAHEKKRTKLGSINLIKHMENRPPELTSRMIEAWMHRTTKTADPDLYDLALGTWKALPTNTQTLVEMTEGMLDALKEARDKSRMGPLMIYNRLPYKPESLCEDTIDNWLKGLVGAVNIEHYTLVLETWQGMTNNNLAEDNARLRWFMEEIGLAASTFVDVCMQHPQRPADLHEDMIYSFFPRRINYREARHARFIMDVFEEMFPADDMAQITRDIKEELNTEQAQTGIAPANLLVSGDENIYLSRKMLNGWMSGKITKARQDHLDLIFERYAGIREKYTDLDHMIERLRIHSRRTATSPRAAFKNSSPTPPPGLNGTVVENWFKGNTKSFQIEHYDYALKVYETLPDAQK